MTITGTEAYEAMCRHHEILGEQLSTRVTALSEAVTAGRPHQAAVADVIAFLADEVLPHAAAEEEMIYPAAVEHAELVGTVNEMVTEHTALSAAAEALAGLADGATAAEQATQIADLFTAHAAREDDELLPALLAADDVDLAALLAQMHSRIDEAGRAVQSGEATTGDPQAALLALLLQAATALARAGQADQACRLAASAWAALREPRPDLAVRVTAALHGLARRGQGDVIQAGSPRDSRETAAGTATATAGPPLDVRSLAPAQRHEAIFAAYRDLAPGAGFVLINDHDPKPLRYQFEAEHAGEFTWESLEAGPDVWRVRIGRAAIASRTRGRPGRAGLRC